MFTFNSLMLLHQYLAYFSEINSMFKKELKQKKFSYLDELITVQRK